MTTFRRATASDSAALARLRAESFAEDHPREPAPESFAREFAEFAAGALSGQDWLAWVAEDDGIPVATTWVHLVPKVPRPHRVTRPWGYVTAVYTSSHARDRGVGGALLREVTEWAAGAGVELLLVWPSERSVPFYERAGFGTTDALVREVTPYED